MGKHMDEDIEVIAETKHLQFVRRGDWSFVRRANSTGVVVVLAMTADEKVLFVEQYRPPVNRQVIEFPAGLAGDIPGSEWEALEEAARRELLEETGYQAAIVERLESGATSAGLTDEMATFFLARNLTKVNAGGGDDSEDIIVHEIPLNEIEIWLTECTHRGCVIAAKIYAGLYLLRREQA